MNSRTGHAEACEVTSGLSCSPYPFGTIVADPCIEVRFRPSILEGRNRQSLQ